MFQNGRSLKITPNAHSTDGYNQDPGKKKSTSKVAQLGSGRAGVETQASWFPVQYPFHAHTPSCCFAFGNLSTDQPVCNHSEVITLSLLVHMLCALWRIWENCDIEGYCMDVLTYSLILMFTECLLYARTCDRWQRGPGKHQTRSCPLGAYGLMTCDKCNNSCSAKSKVLSATQEVESADTQTPRHPSQTAFWRGSIWMKLWRMIRLVEGE